MICKIVDSPIDITEWMDIFESKSLGALCSFTGIVRSESRGQKVTHLEYHTYKEMAEKKMLQTVSEAKNKYKVSDLLIVHRVGTLQVGEIAVFILAASPHRDAAFKACRFSIDRIKQIVPIWKKEYGEGGAVWIEDCPIDITQDASS